MHQRSLPRESTSSPTPQSPAEPAADYGPLLNLTVWALVGVASLFIVLRIYCKLLRRLSLWWDDYILLAGWVGKPALARVWTCSVLTSFVRQVAIVISAALQSVCANLGLGKQSHDDKQKSFSDLLFYSYLAGFFSILAAAWTKTSFAVTLLRISQGRIYHLVWFIIVSVNLVIGANAIIQWVQCTPVEKLWKSASGSCWPRFVVRDYNTFVSGEYIHANFGHR